MNLASPIAVPPARRLPVRRLLTIRTKLAPLLMTLSTVRWAPDCGPSGPLDG